MSAWRTDPNSAVSAPRHLAEKFKDLGWFRLFKVEQRRIAAQADEVCQHLPADRIQVLADTLGIIAPVRRSKKPLPSRGKDALMERIRNAYRSRGVATQD